MLHPLISKIRCNNPNKNASAMRNHNLLVYIGTREGVDLSDESMDEKIKQTIITLDNDAQILDDITYQMTSISNNNGLFGNIDTTDINLVANSISAMTRERRNIYNGILSLHEDDAVLLGYDKKTTWKNTLAATLPDIAKEFGIKIDKLQWVAAVHMEVGHPHVHYMFWRTDDKVQSSFIHSSVQNRCRMIFAKNVYAAIREQEAINKTLARDSTISVTKEELEELSKIMNPHNSIPAKFFSADQKILIDKMQELITLLPSSGRITYKLIPPDVKLKVDEIVKSLTSRPDVRKEIDKFYESVDNLSDGYSAGQRKKEINRIHAKLDLEKRLGNVVLATAKVLRNEERSYNQEQHYMQYMKTAATFSLLRGFTNTITEMTKNNNAADPYAQIKPSIKRKKRSKKAISEKNQQRDTR